MSEINAFSITCKYCDAKKDRHQTNVFINFIKKYYMFICYNCGTTEAFDEFGKKVDLKSEPKKENDTIN